MSHKQPRKTVAFDRFDPQTLNNGNVVLMIGKRGTGKSICCRAMLSELKDRFSYGVAFCGSEGPTGFYSQFMPDILIYEGMDFDVLDRIFLLQKERVRQMGYCKETAMLMVIDDILDEGPQIWRSKQLTKVFTAGRHSNITAFVLVQYARGIPPMVRTNVDWALLFGDPIRTNRKRLHDEYAGVFASFKDFTAAFESLTTNRECMVVQLSNVMTADVRKSVFFFKAVLDPPRFMLFDPEFAAFDKKHNIANQPKKQRQDAERNRRTAPMAG